MQTLKPLRLVILISGYGSNLQAIIDAIAKQQLTAEIVAVISDRDDAYGLTRARQAGIETVTIAPKQYSSPEHFDQSLQETIAHFQPELIVLAGFMRILGKACLDRFSGRIINIHPSLLPKYKGLNTHQRILTAKECEHGTSIHFVTEALDGGPVIAQTRLQVHPQDTSDSLKERIQKLEHWMYPKIIKWFSENRIKLTPKGVMLNNKVLSKTGYQFDVTELDD